MSEGHETSADFIRRAVEIANLDAVRLALFQNTGDAGIGALPPAAALSDSQRALLVNAPWRSPRIALA